MFLPSRPLLSLVESEEGSRAVSPLLLEGNLGPTQYDCNRKSTVITISLSLIAHLQCCAKVLGHFFEGQ